MTTSNPRYHGKPLLRLLECYVLWAIGELSQQDAMTLQAMTPKLQALYSAQGEWQAVIESAVKLPAQMPDLIRSMWTKNSEIARRNGTVLSPQHFAEMFVDQNLAS